MLVNIINEQNILININSKDECRCFSFLYTHSSNNEVSREIYFFIGLDHEDFISHKIKSFDIYLFMFYDDLDLK
jgi:hypothetical protein